MESAEIRPETGFWPAGARLLRALFLFHASLFFCGLSTTGWLFFQAFLCELEPSLVQ